MWFKTSNTERFLAALGAGAIALPQGLGKTTDIKLDLTLTPDRRLALRDVVADLGGNALTGAADITLNGTPDVNAQFNVGTLDLTGFARSDTSGSPAPASSTAAPAPASSSGWSTAPIDASALAGFNGEIALRADSIDLGTLSLGATRVLLRNDRSRLVAELREIRAYLWAAR